MGWLVVFLAVMHQPQKVRSLVNVALIVLCPRGCGVRASGINFSMRLYFAVLGRGLCVVVRDAVQVGRVVEVAVACSAVALFGYGEHS